MKAMEAWGRGVERQCLIVPQAYWPLRTRSQTAPPFLSLPLCLFSLFLPPLSLPLPNSSGKLLPTQMLGTPQCTRDSESAIWLGVLFGKGLGLKPEDLGPSFRL